MSLNELALSDAKLLCDIVGENRRTLVADVKGELTGDSKQNHSGWNF